MTGSRCEFGEGGRAILGFSSRKDSKPVIDRAQSLAAIPTLNQGLKVDKDNAGNAVIRVRLTRGKGFMARFQPPVIFRMVELDELGSFVFRQVDGNASVLEIIERFIARFKTNRREAELSTVDFLKSLMKRGVISMVVK